MFLQSGCIQWASPGWIQMLERKEMIVKAVHCMKCLRPYLNPIEVTEGTQKLADGWIQFIFTREIGPKLGQHSSGVFCPRCFRKHGLWLSV